MGLYSRFIFPRLLEFVMSRPHMMAGRRQVLADARGRVLEIGFGTGLNLECYPRGVERLTLIDPVTALPKKVARRVKDFHAPVTMVELDAATLPFDAAQFDCVVSTWTLCTIPDVESALAEVRRVLKPGGSFLFLEHGRSDDPQVARRQDRWNPVQRVIGVGCNLNRPIDRLIREAGLELAHLERFLMPHTPQIAAEHYLGRATT